ncbi:MAG: TonB-dependent receptor [Rickettsiales bacterium]|nr:TonB-dependent receptor [Rickettsiales bacterium]
MPLSLRFLLTTAACISFASIASAEPLKKQKNMAKPAASKKIEAAASSAKTPEQSTTEAATQRLGIDDARRIIKPLKVYITKGYWEPVKDLPGSAYYIDENTIDKTNASDINRLVRQVPGVNIVEEEGFGNKPNIGMRGSRIDRSADITLMEDGVLSAPAPYAAPQSYYFPRIERMEGIEVRKGASAIEFGPRTTNGALNLLTHSVPSGPMLYGDVAVGSYGGFRNSLRAGSASENVSFLVEGHNEASDGFKEVDIVGGDTGFNQQDYMGKLKFKTDASADLYQELELKIGYNEDNSNETYLGLTSADFNANPYRRYAASQTDQFDAVHNLYQLSHTIEPFKHASISTQLYRNDYTRTWDKLESVIIGGTRRSIAAILNDPATNSAYLDILRGGNSAANALTATEARREFFSHGIQSKLNYNFNAGEIKNELTTGIRIHQDRYDRLHRDKNYQMVDGVMVLTSEGAFGTQTNRIGTARTWSAFTLNRMSYGAFSLTPGARYEYIDLKTENYGTSDPARSGANLQNFRSTINAFTPGLSGEYALSNEWILLAGVHKGFSPPEPPTSNNAAENAKAEESINYEFGTRFSGNQFKADVVGFLTDYENLLGADTFSSGGGGADQFNGGEVRTYGLEAALGYEASKEVGIDTKKIKLPLQFNYTYLRSSFENSFSSTFSEWGNVSKGNELPYIPRHQFYVSAGLDHADWSVTLGGKYVDKMRTVAGSGPLLYERSTDAHFIMDVNAEMRLINDVRGYVSLTNAFDDEYIAARRPAGSRPGAPRMIYAGVKAEF